MPPLNKKVPGAVSLRQQPRHNRGNGEHAGSELTCRMPPATMAAVAVMSALVSAYMWSVGLIVFGWFCVNTIVASLFLPAEVYNPYLKRILRRFFHFLFIPVKVDGWEGLDPEKSYLFMSNHVSIFDMPLLGGWGPGILRSVEAERQFRWPLYGLAARRLGNIPIRREDVFASMRSLRRAVRRLGRNRSFLIMPEAHRTLDGRLGPFKRLPFLMAKQAGVDLVPVGMSGLFSLKSKRSWQIRPGPLKLSFGEVIPAGTVDRLSLEELRDLTRQRIQELVEWP
jgi:1-acyl-sn-glycerol-3-phosphate acyltransferase